MKARYWCPIFFIAGSSLANGPAKHSTALRTLRPGGTLSSVGVYSGHLKIPIDAIGAGLADQTMATTLCPGGKERRYRLMRLVQSRRIDLTPLLTHAFPLEKIGRAYELLNRDRTACSKWEFACPERAISRMFTQVDQPSN